VTSGWGVAGSSASASGIGVYAYNSNGGTALHSNGDAIITGDLTVGNPNTSSYVLQAGGSTHGLYGDGTTIGLGGSSVNGYGVYAFSGGDGYALYADTVGSAKAGYFNGRRYYNGQSSSKWNM